MKTYLKENKGIAATDALIAVLIIALFTGIIATLLYNIYISNTSLKRMSKANLYVVDVLEYVQKIYYSDLDTTSNLSNQFSYLQTSQNMGNPDDQDLVRMWALEGNPEEGYDMKVTLDKYMPSNDSLDLVRKITVTVGYKVGNKYQLIEVSNIKNRENLAIPNKPDLALIEIQQNEQKYPIKYENNTYTVCSENDNDWYDYNIEVPSSSISAKIIISSTALDVGDIIDENDYTIYEWVPRYAEDNEQNIVFLYSNSNKYLETYTANGNSYTRLTQITNDYTVNVNCANNTGYWNEI